MSESEPSQALFYCHECQDEWNAQETDVGMPCPSCGSDFTEVIDQSADPRDILHDDGDDFEDDDEYDDDEDVDGLDFNVAPGDMPAFISGNIFGNNTDHGRNREMMGMLRGLIQQLTGDGQPPARADSNENGRTTSEEMPGQPQQAAGANVQFTFGSMAGGMGVAGTGRGDRQENGPGHVPVTDLSTFLQQAFGGLAGGPADGGFAFGGQAGGGLGRNLGDYVFSNRGFDEVVSRLMEQHQGSDAPPPTPEHIINAIPTFLVDENTAKSERDCAVCKDDWQVGETALRLPCSHCFHDQCIKPWLKVNSTCPVCRSSVLGSGTAQGSAEQAGGSNAEGVTVGTQASSGSSNPMPGSYPATASAPDILEQDDLD